MEFKSKKTKILKSWDAERTDHQPVIYYIEDNDFSRKINAKLIRSWGFDVVTEANPVTILIDVVIDMVDMIVLDFAIHGFEPIHYVPLIEKTGIPLIFYSGHDEDYIRKYFEANNYHLPNDVICVQKPYSDQLKACIEAYVAIGENKVIFN